MVEWSAGDEPVGHDPSAANADHHLIEEDARHPFSFSDRSAYHPLGGREVRDEAALDSLRAMMAKTDERAAPDVLGRTGTVWTPDQAADLVGAGVDYAHQSSVSSSILRHHHDLTTHDN
jgi:hypothetical protein